jgi:succinoglycan biosynthesis transport protein ExoP
MSPNSAGGRSGDLSISQALRVIRERKWVIILLPLLAVILSLTLSLLSTPQFRATSRVVLQTAALDKALFGAQVFQIYDQQRLLTTAADLVKLNRVADAVKVELNSERSSQALKNMVTVSTASAADIINISAVSSSASEAAAVANAFARQFILHRQESDRATLRSAREQVQAQLDAMTPEQQSSTRGQTLAQKIEELTVLESMQTGGFEMAQEATPPGEAFAPRTQLNAGIALVLGLALGLAVAFVLHFADRRIKDEETIERELGLPVIASVPLTKGKWNGKNGERSSLPVGFLEPGSLALEAYRKLRSNLRFFEVTRPIRSIFVTSALPGEGKSVTAINLALTYAMSGFRVIIVEGDLRRPMLQEYLSLKGRLGFSNLLAGTHRISDVVQVVDTEALLPRDIAASGPTTAETPRLGRDLICITAGPLPPNPAELLASDVSGDVLRELGALCDYLIIDGPPLLLVSDALELATKVDGVVLVTRLRSTTIDEARKTRDGLDKVGIKPLGVVVSGVARPSSYYRRYSGYYAEV